MVRFGQDIAMILQAGDVLCLQGDLGAGKTTLARAIIRKLADKPDLEVPSPTYTLCQIYAGRLAVSHFDFYRIGDPEELAELGFDEAAEGGVAIVEWPERGTGMLPANAAWISLETTEGEGRRAVIRSRSSNDPTPEDLAWRITRSLSIRDFLNLEWGPGVNRAFLTGDASTRRYEIVEHGVERRILMDAPKRPDGPPVRDGAPYSRIAHLAEDVVPFIAIAETLSAAGLAAPAIHARRNREGLLLIEHLGEGKIVGQDGRPLAERYIESAKLVALVHKRQWPEEIAVADEHGAQTIHRISRYDHQAFSIEASLFVDWYAPAYAESPLTAEQIAEFHAIWGTLVDILEPSPVTLVLRDFHSPNIIWRGSETFPRNIGLIDFQDAVIGPQAYDLVSLAQDARIAIPEELEGRIVDAYLKARKGDDGFKMDSFKRNYAILGAHRATKILGIFVRLNVRDGKPGYLKHLPRIRSYLKRNLAHPVLEPYRVWCETAAGLGAAADEPLK